MSEPIPCDKWRPERPKDTIREQAEEIAGQTASVASGHVQSLSLEEAQRLLHELRVHQIELELQNEELLAANAEKEVARARYYELYHFAPVGYCTIDQQSHILEANLRAAALLRVNRAGLIPQPMTRFVFPADQDIYYLCHKKCFELQPESLDRAGKALSCELRLVRGDGTVFWARMECSGAVEVEGKPAVRMLFSDITDEKRIQQEKAELEAQERAIQKAESLARMAGAIAHHLNNQLQVIQSCLEFAVSNVESQSNSRPYLDTAIKATKKATDIGASMLTYLGKAMVRHEPIDLSEVCRNCARLLHLVVPKTIFFLVDFPPSGPIILGHIDQIQQMLTNLVFNAIESMEAGRGGRIEVCIRTVSQSEVYGLKGFPRDWRPQVPSYACLEVRDTGCGIPEKDVENIFDPFFSTKLTGRGLGLAVALGIVRGHSGMIAVKSEPGRGSVFQVFLPIMEEARSTRQHLPDLQEPRQPE